MKIYKQIVKGKNCKEKFLLGKIVSYQEYKLTGKMDIRNQSGKDESLANQQADFIFEEEQDEKQVAFNLENRAENRIFLDSMIGNLIRYMAVQKEIETDFNAKITEQFGPNSFRKYIVLPCKAIFDQKRRRSLRADLPRIHAIQKK